MKTTSAVLTAFVVACSLTTVAAPARAASQIPPWGLYLDYMDRSAKPGEDFNLYANGGWLKKAEIPADRSYTGSWLELDTLNQGRLKGIVAELHARRDLNPEERKLRDLYDAFTDQAQIEARGLKPIEKDLAAIAALKTREDVARVMGNPALGLGGLFALRIWPDDKHPLSYTVQVRQAGLLLPDRDYYLREDPALADTRDAYKKYLAATLASVGVPAADAEKRAEAVYAVEREIATAHWPAADRRDPDRMYNPMSIAELQTLAPEYPWKTHFTAAGVPLKAKGADRMVLVREKSGFPALAKTFAATPVPVWRDYLTIRCVHAFATYLPHRYEEADFAFFGKKLQGNAQDLPRDTRGVRLLDRRMGEGLGKIFVAKYFSAEAKTRVRAMVDNLIQAFDEDLNTLDWLTAETRAKAKEKLHQITVKVGYPDHWRDYSALVIRRDDLVGSIKNSNAFNWRRDVVRVDGPVDRSEWIMTPPTVNAYYEETVNEIVFPAGILQPPRFDPQADEAANYGGVGTTIGHEISHGFDDLGSKYDGTGMLRSWWTPEDRAKFDARTSVLVEQYNAYEPLPGLHVNGRLTLGENIGDLAGLEIAHKAYKIALGGKEAPVLDGLTGDQRFYLGYAQVWRGKTRDEATRQRVLSNEHSPGEFRINGVMRNDDGWYAAFPEIGPNDRFYLAPEKRVRLW